MGASASSTKRRLWMAPAAATTRQGATTTAPIRRPVLLVEGRVQDTTLTMDDWGVGLRLWDSFVSLCLALAPFRFRPNGGLCFGCAFYAELSVSLF